MSKSEWVLVFCLEELNFIQKNVVVYKNLKTENIIFFKYMP